MNWIKDKILEIYEGKLARDAAEGKYGPKVQAFYLWSKGKKTITGMILFLIFGAVVSFDPPYAKTFFAYCAGASAALMGLGVLDAGWNNRPAFPEWFLESLKRIMGAVAAFHGLLVPITEAIHVFYPSGDQWLHKVELYEAAISVACGYINRYAATSLAPPPQMVPATSITGEFSLKETMEAVKNAPLVPERRLSERPVEADAAGEKK